MNYNTHRLVIINRTSKSIFIIWAPYRAITSSLFVLCYVCRTAGSAQKKRSLLVAQTLHKALNKAFRSILGAALGFNLHLKTSAAFLILFYFFREIFIALFLNKLNNNKAYRVFEGRLISEIRGLYFMKLLHLNSWLISNPFFPSTK